MEKYHQASLLACIRYLKVNSVGWFSFRADLRLIQLCSFSNNVLEPNRFSLGPAPRPGWVMVLMCLSVCVLVCPPTHNSYSPIIHTLNYGWNCELWVIFWIMGELLNNVWTFEWWLNFWIMGDILKIWVNFKIMGELLTCISVIM